MFLSKQNARAFDLLVDRMTQLAGNKKPMSIVSSMFDELERDMARAVTPVEGSKRKWWKVALVEEEAVKNDDGELEWREVNS